MNPRSSTHAYIALIDSKTKTKPSVTRIHYTSANTPGLAPPSATDSIARTFLPSHPSLSQDSILAATVARNFPTSQLLIGKHVIRISMKYINLIDAGNLKNSFGPIISVSIWSLLILEQVENGWTHWRRLAWWIEPPPTPQDNNGVQSQGAPVYFARKTRHGPGWKEGIGMPMKRAFSKKSSISKRIISSD